MIQGPDMGVHTVMLLVLSTVGVMGKAVPASFCHMSPDPHHGYYPGQLVNCSGRGLNTIPTDLPRDTTTLLLNSNNLTIVPDYAFHQLSQLRELDLSTNLITRLQRHAFHGLSNLTKLSLWDNCLVLSPQTYPPDLFKTLISLKSLILSRNVPYQRNQRDTESEQGVGNGVYMPGLWNVVNKCLKPHVRDSPLSSRHELQKTNIEQTMHSKAGQLAPSTKTFSIHNDQIQTTDLDYPEDALSHLTNLYYLSMDGLANRSFGPGFKNLTKLTHLDLNGKTGHCYTCTIDDKTFLNLPTITHLNLSECNVFSLTPDAFKFQQNLEDLDLSYNEELGFSQLGSAFYGLSFTKLTRLTIDLVTHSRSLGTIIQSSDLHHFKKLQFLQRLQARFNRIEGIEQEILCQSMPPNLKYINADGNLWELAPYVNDMHCLKSLERLDVNGMDAFWTPPLRPPDTNTDRPISVHNRQFGNDGFRAEFSSAQTSHASLTTDEISDECKGKRFHVPPRLESFSARNVGMNYKFEKVRITVQNSLKRIDLSQNYLPEWHGPVCGFQNVTELYLMNTFAEYISSTFFLGFPTLQILNISSNMLRAVFQHDKTGKIFQGLENLRVLDISRNNLGHFQKTSLLPLQNLEELYLSVNGMGTFTLALSHMNKLRHLDISQNQLRTIPKDVRDHLDMLSEKFNVTVNMTFNPIACICPNIDFLRWIRESKVYFGTEKNYYCLQPDGTSKEMENLKGTIADLERQCGSYVGIFVGASAICIIFITMLSVALGYRFRWKLRYLYYASRLSLQGQQHQSQQQVFRFDAFISFSSEDSDFVDGELKQQLENNHGLRLCIHTRDFTPGQYIASNIVKSVQTSRRTLVVLSRALLASDWCHYELQMALMESARTGRDVLIFLLYENVPAEELSRDMLANLQTTVYIEFPRSEVDKGLFWARLAQALRE